MVAPHFVPSRLYNIEDIEDYQPGGYHPIYIGDTFDQGQYRILHKLGFGGSSTVWLVRDQREGKDYGRIATLKAMHADMFSQSPGEIPKLAISKKLIQSLPPSHSAGFQTVDHHFLVQGPNGSYQFLIYPLAGPSISLCLTLQGGLPGVDDCVQPWLGGRETNSDNLPCTGVVHASGGKAFPTFPDISVSDK